jgi:hypothetical protein
MPELTVLAFFKKNYCKNARTDSFGIFLILFVKILELLVPVFFLILLVKMLN